MYEDCQSSCRVTCLPLAPVIPQDTEQPLGFEILIVALRWLRDMPCKIIKIWRRDLAVFSYIQ